MSMDRLADYTGRHWALNLDAHGITASVHHFISEEMRDAWVAMDPELRVPASPFHRDVKRWLKADPARASWWRRVLNFLHLTGILAVFSDD